MCSNTALRVFLKAFLGHPTPYWTDLYPCDWWVEEAQVLIGRAVRENSIVSCLASPGGQLSNCTLIGSGMHTKGHARGSTGDSEEPCRIDLSRQLSNCALVPEPAHRGTLDKDARRTSRNAIGTSVGDLAAVGRIVNEHELLHMLRVGSSRS